MRLIAFAAVSSLALMAAAGCAPHVDYAHKTTLDCPDRQGELRRTGISPDRKSCTYQAAEGAEVTLQLAAVNGDPGAVLSAVETSLIGPAAPGQAPKADDKGKDDGSKDDGGKTDKPGAAEAATNTTTTTTTTTASGDAAAKAAQQASADATSGKGAWSSDDDDKGHGIVVHDGGGSGKDNAHIRLPGLHIDADESTGNARVDIAGVHIDANDEDATVHVTRDVRLRGQGFSRERNGLRATFIAKRENLPDGYRFVGYQAAGPKTGPLTIAIVKSRDEIDDGNRLYRDIRRLVRRNGGA